MEYVAYWALSRFRGVRFSSTTMTKAAGLLQKTTPRLSVVSNLGFVRRYSDSSDGVMVLAREPTSLGL
jgi:hypothetical protein